MDLNCVGSLKNKKEFDFVYKRGIKRYAKNFTLYLIELGEGRFLFQDRLSACNNFLLGLSISKKVGKAVKRNLIKRRVRFLCKSHFQKLENYAMIFVAKDGITQLSYEELERDFLKCLRIPLSSGLSSLRTKPYKKRFYNS
ncbi:ribonuclease P protein component [Helicobacter sp. 11S03491-1]|uniref:ribonuclease P protein component n=1 Tax=Helicobacter sp. 11S03491-1 TaxID=1476196 RepID=UPI000BD93520|nr:ribonuclease P protein component [Helicobacter sp. 11S03491-1]PAF41702.1 ribonuclease P protein component [Helicobacter sp. 11S03491-1]